MTEFTLSERTWTVIKQLLLFVSGLGDIDFAILIQSLMQKGDGETKLRRIFVYFNTHAA
jgi:hypothetical protein